MTTVTRQFEWDMGHRVTNHESLCKNPHGHRYKLMVEVTGPLNETHNHAAQGMVLDFGALKQLVNETVVDRLDHSFMYWGKDAVMKTFAQANKDLKLVAVSFVPTAECIVSYIAEQLQKALDVHMPNISVSRLELNETPNCKAIWER